MIYYVSAIKALDHFNVTNQGGLPKANLRPYRLHQDDVVGVEPPRYPLGNTVDIGTFARHLQIASLTGIRCGGEGTGSNWLRRRNAPARVAVVHPRPS
jgi:hypothetical protein